MVIMEEKEKISSFTTKSGTLYEIDSNAKTIKGGVNCPAPMKYQTINVRNGAPAFVVLEDGSYFKTSKVEKIAYDFCKNDSALHYQGFVTGSGTLFVVDETNQMICGGKYCPYPQKYRHLDIKQGERASVVLENGNFFSTSEVERVNVPVSQVEMIELRTQNSVYLINFSDKTIRNLLGSTLIKNTKFEGIEGLKVGSKAKIWLEDENVLTTSVIKDVRDVSQFYEKESATLERSEHEHL